MSDSTLTFGKHAGKKLSEVPRDYLEWLANQNIHKQPEAALAAKTFLSEHPVSIVTKPRPQEPGPKPFYYKDARTKDAGRRETTGARMHYTAIGNKHDGWNIYRIDDDPDVPPILVPHLVKGRIEPYPHRQGAWRRVKQLNEALEEIDAMIKRDGAIFL